MSLFRPKLWTAAGGALVIAAGGLAACSGPAEEPSAAPPGAHAGEAGEGEGGEAGANSAYDAISADSRTALRLAHLKGFMLVAREAAPVEGEAAAAALAGQGMLEVYDPAKETYDAAGVDEAVLRRAAESGTPATLNAAISELDRAARDAGGDPAEVVKGLTSISTGLYRLVIVEDTVDPVEYQHALGAAMAAQAAAARAGGLSSVRDDLDAFVGLWPQVTAPDSAETAPSVSEVQAQASRIELALSGL